MAGLVVVQLLLSGRVVLLELASPNSPAGRGLCRSFFRMQLKAGESSSWTPTRLSSILAVYNIIGSVWNTDCLFLLCRWGGKRA